MLVNIGISASVFLYGVPWLTALAESGRDARSRWRRAHARARIAMLSRYDLFIVSNDVGFLRRPDHLLPLRSFRRPVYFYEVFAPAGSRNWVNQFPEGALDAFDAFLAVSTIHDDPPIHGPPVFSVGMDLLERSAEIAPRPFQALLDFARPGYESEREVQKAVLADLRVPSFALSGEYSFDKIVEAYRTAAISFVAFPEAFGVPIVQLQYLGSHIATPHVGWVKRHLLLPEGTVFAEPGQVSDLSGNFIVYTNPQDLREKLRASMSAYDPTQVRNRLIEAQGHYVHGDLKGLRDALQYAESLPRH